MKTLSAIKKDLEFNCGLASLIETLKTVAVTQFKTLEGKIRYFEKLSVAINSFFELIDIKRVNHPFLQLKNKPALVVAVTSDSGLLGGLNMQVIRQALDELGNAGKIVVIGERGKIHIKERDIPFVSFPGIHDDERYAQAMQLRDYVLNKMLTNAFGSAKVVYPHPISFTLQEIETFTLLPFTTQQDSPPNKGVTPPVIFESDIGDIIEYLAYLWMGQKFYAIFGLSRLSEFAARFMHLEESHERLKEMDRKARLEYFRVRHELIDRNMRELFSARLLYASQS